MLLSLCAQVEAQLSAVRSLLLNGSPGGAGVASAAHQAAADLLSAVPRADHRPPGGSPQAFEGCSPQQQQQQQQTMHHSAARRSLAYSPQQTSPFGGCRAPSPLGLNLQQIPGSPASASGRDQTPRLSAQHAAANLGQLAAMKAEVARAMAALVE
jgi:hypothetical protein